MLSRLHTHTRGVAATSLLIALAGAAVLAGLLVGGWPAAQAPAPAEGSMTGQVVLVTGSTDGLGREVALRSAALGAEVIVHGRNRERGEAVVAEIAKAGGRARFYAADLGSLAEVRTLGQAILRDYDRLDVLVNNAGIWIRERQESADGHELHFAVNYLSHYLLTRTLLPRLVSSAPSRIVSVSSGAQSPIDFDDVMLEQPRAAGRGYAQSKLAQVMFTFDLAEELQGKGVTVTALHPATMMDTSLVREAGGRAMSTVDEGADAVMQLVAGEDIEHGRYYNGLRPSRANDQAYDEAARARLRALSDQLTGAGAD